MSCTLSPSSLSTSIMSSTETHARNGIVAGIHARHRACLLWVSKIKSVRIRASKPFRAKACSVLSRPVPKLHLEVPAAIENAFDEHRIRRDDEGDCNAPLESGHSQSGQEIVALCTPQRKRARCRNRRCG